MKKSQKITTLFLDVGGVLLTNGWDHRSRQLAIKTFNLDEKEFNSRHTLNFDVFELGKMSLEEYLKRVVFFEPRSFSLETFKQFVFEQSQPFPEMLKMIQEIKNQFGLKYVVLSNEGQEIAKYRFEKFKFKEFIDVFVTSGFVGYRKPDRGIYDLAIYVANVNPEEVIYIDDRQPLIEVGREFGLKGICHKDLELTKKQLLTFLES